MRKLLNLWLTGMFCAFAVLSLVPEPKMAASDPVEVNLTAPTLVLAPEEQTPMKPCPSVSAKGWALMDASSGRVIVGENYHDPLAVASTTKIMSALIALEQPNRDDMFMVGDEIIVEGSSMGLQLGDNVSLYGLAAGMLLASGNDAANATAKRVAGSVDAFAEVMNAKAAELGMNNSYFTTPSGLDKDENHSTAFDMGLLAIAAIQNDDFLELCSAKKTVVQKGTPPSSYTVYNHNRLLDMYDSAIGIKTGFTKRAGRCLVSAAEKDGLTLVMVTLGAADDFNTHRNIYEWAFDSLSYRVFDDYVKDASVAVVGGEEQRVQLSIPWSLGAYMLPSESSAIKVQISLPAFEYAPISQGQVIGEVTIRKGDSVLATAPLTAQRDVASVKMGAFESIWEKFLAWL